MMSTGSQMNMIAFRLVLPFYSLQSGAYVWSANFYHNQQPALCAHHKMPYMQSNHAGIVMISGSGTDCFGASLMLQPAAVGDA